MHGIADGKPTAGGIAADIEADDLLAYSVPQVAKLLDVRERLVWELIRKEELKSFKIGFLRRVAREDLLAYLNQLRDAA